MNESFENEVGNWSSEDEAFEAQDLFDSYKKIRNFNFSDVETLKHLVFLEIQLNRVRETIIEKNKQKLEEKEREKEINILIDSIINLKIKCQKIRDILGKKYLTLGTKISFEEYKIKNRNLYQYKHLTDGEIEILFLENYREYWISENKLKSIH